jgi:hypothetical protein
VLAGNTLAGIPDRQADNAVMKKSIAVMYGSRAPQDLRSGLYVWLFSHYFSVVFSDYTLVSFLLVSAGPSNGLVLCFLFKLLWSDTFDRGLMGYSLVCVILFGLVCSADLIRE